MKTYEVTVNGEPVGEVRLTPKASRDAMESALSSIGLYVPRGMDRVRWSASGLTCHIRTAERDDVWLAAPLPRPAR